MAKMKHGSKQDHEKGRECSNEEQECYYEVIADTAEVQGQASAGTQRVVCAGGNMGTSGGRGCAGVVFDTGVAMAMNEAYGVVGKDTTV